ncbi:hypothetical protein NHF46_24000 [Arthrobacter alpinus]|nr:hypothetical protein [Arthrobacter alpinus]
MTLVLLFMFVMVRLFVRHSSQPSSVKKPVSVPAAWPKLPHVKRYACFQYAKGLMTARS